MDIRPAPIKIFLDSVDMVLNSNTFLLEFDPLTADINAELYHFLHSASFIEQLAKQDIERNWLNMHYFDNTLNAYQLKNGHILKDNMCLKMQEVVNEKNDYLVAMLTGDTSAGRFLSFYSKQLDKVKAKNVVDHFTSYLSVYEAWRLFVVEPDFLKNATEKYPKGEELRYFQGDFGNDSATVILTKDKAYLLLTNGID